MKCKITFLFIAISIPESTLINKKLFICRRLHTKGKTSELLATVKFLHELLVIIMLF